ncbi:unnamed protein product [Mesocestoides corti]|uniref:Uncharacterized protein n=1 Tax=Mesocestoides corti TaxID=53468 RepID=A0A0R3UF27_MESCO|nr:unnamed protein product [Mesocestoides corti]
MEPKKTQVKCGFIKIPEYLVYSLVLLAMLSHRMIFVKYFGHTQNAFTKFTIFTLFQTLMVGDSGGSVYVYAMKNFPSVGTSAEEATKLTSVLASCLSSQLPT